MPWTPDSFKAKHNHNLSGTQAGEASRIANAILNRTGDEGLAIATANARAEHKPRHDVRHPRTGRFIAANHRLRHAIAGGKGTRPTQ